MDRRRFLKLAGISGIGLTVPNKLDELFNDAVPLMPLAG
jgi:hypothetical protein